jgi:hypothetical protein
MLRVTRNGQRACAQGDGGLPALWGAFGYMIFAILRPTESKVE